MTESTLEFERWKEAKRQVVNETSLATRQLLLSKLFTLAAQLTEPTEYVQAFHSAEIFLFKDGNPINADIANNVVTIALNDPVCAAIEAGLPLDTAKTKYPFQNAFLQAVNPSPGLALLKQLLDNVASDAAIVVSIRQRLTPSIVRIVDGMSPIVH